MERVMNATERPNGYLPPDYVFVEEYDELLNPLKVLRDLWRMDTGRDLLPMVMPKATDRSSITDTITES